MTIGMSEAYTTVDICYVFKFTLSCKSINTIPRNEPLLNRAASPLRDMIFKRYFVTFQNFRTTLKISLKPNLHLPARGCLANDRSIKMEQKGFE